MSLIQPRKWDASMLDRLAEMLRDETAAEACSCPRWCQENGKHSWEAQTVTGYPVRTHSADFGMISVTADEMVDSDGVHMDPPVARWYGPEQGRRLHPGDAARLADDVAAAFALIGSVTP